MDLPPSYSAATSAGLVSIDFLPTILSPGGMLQRPSYEPFHVLRERANQYLLGNPDITINTCETVEFATYNHGNRIVTENSTYVINGESSNVCVRGLRLWLRRCSRPLNAAPQQIGYYNILPMFISDGNVERLDSVLNRVNELFQRESVGGRIITIETQPIKWGSKGPLPDETVWTERGNASESFINLLRVFYIAGKPHRQKIAFADFIPELLSKGGWFKSPVVETFPAVLEKARQWLLSVPPNYRPVNVQTVTFRYSRNIGFDTMAMSYSENKVELVYVRYLRIGYLLEDLDKGPIARGTLSLDSKLFVPRMYKAPGTLSNGEMEGALEVRGRIDAWVSATGAAVISVESLYMRVEGGGEAQYGFDAMQTWNGTTPASHGARRRGDEAFVCLYRVYTAGSFPDPPETEGDRALEAYARSCGKSCVVM